MCDLLNAFHNPLIRFLFTLSDTVFAALWLGFCLRYKRGLMLKCNFVKISFITLGFIAITHVLMYVRFK